MRCKHALHRIMSKSLLNSLSTIIAPLFLFYITFLDSRTHCTKFSPSHDRSTKICHKLPISIDFNMTSSQTATFHITNGPIFNNEIHWRELNVKESNEHVLKDELYWTIGPRTLEPEYLRSFQMEITKIEENALREESYEYCVLLDIQTSHFSRLDARQNIPVEQRHSEYNFVFDLLSNQYATIYAYRTSEEPYKGMRGSTLYANEQSPAHKYQYQWKSIKPLETDSRKGLVVLPSVHALSQRSKSFTDQVNSTIYFNMQYLDYVYSEWEIVKDIHEFPNKPTELPVVLDLMNSRQAYYFMVNVPAGGWLVVTSTGDSWLHTKEFPTPKNYLLHKNTDTQGINAVLTFRNEADDAIMTYILVYPHIDLTPNHIKIHLQAVSLRVIILLSIAGIVITWITCIVVFIFVKHRLIDLRVQKQLSRQMGRVSLLLAQSISGYSSEQVDETDELLRPVDIQ